MKKRLIGILVLVLAVAGGAETYPFTPAVSKRKLKVVRKYDVVVMSGQTNIVEIPAMFSFAGATNEQVIESSVFTFSIPPDEKSIVCHERGAPRKMYRLVWKNPTAVRISITQEMVILMTARNKLCTEAQLPYPEAVRKKFNDYLGKSSNGNINPYNPALHSICTDLGDSFARRRAKVSPDFPISRPDTGGKEGNDCFVRESQADQFVSDVCDWVVDHIERFKGESYGSDKALETKRGNSYAMASLACSILRKMGIPCDVVVSKYVEGSTNYGYGFIEVYFPDAGWVFYDPAFSERGFKSLDSLIVCGWAYQVQNDPKKKFEWVDGFFCDEWDVMKYQEPQPMTKKAISNTPVKQDALSVMVAHRPVPAGLPIRQQPLRDLLLDPNTLPPEIVEKKAADKDVLFDSDRPKDKVRKEKEG